MHSEPPGFLFADIGVDDAVAVGQLNGSCAGAYHRLQPEGFPVEPASAVDCFRGKLVVPVPPIHLRVVVFDRAMVDPLFRRLLAGRPSVSDDGDLNDLDGEVVIVLIFVPVQLL